MFWQANKWGIIALVVGGSLLGAVYTYFLSSDKVLAERILSTGVCVLLFAIALGTFLAAKKGK